MVRLSGYPKWLLKKFNATVINDIWPELLFFTVVATMVCLVSEFRVSLGISPQMLTVLGTILGLVVSFRTSSAYDRYWEGRKLWSTIALSSRQLAQIIWIHVPSERKKPELPEGSKQLTPNELRIRAMLEKRTMINLVQAYSVSMKHFLRGETGIFYEDLYPLVAFLPRFVPGTTQQNPLDNNYGPYASPPPQADGGAPPPATAAENGKSGQTGPDVDQLPLWYQSLRHQPPPFKKRPITRAKTFEPEKVLPTINADVQLRPARNPPKSSIWNFLPFLIPFRWLAKKLSRRVRAAISSSGEERSISGKVRKPPKVESNVPVEITLFLSSYLSFLLKNGLLQAALATAYSNQLQSLQDCTMSLERVRNTPIPFAYQVHLRMSIWIYLILLPFEIYSSFKWITIPMTLFASFLIIGFLEIGQEIERPFDYQENDLDLDGFCLGIQRDMHEICAHIVNDPMDFVLSSLNQPLAPVDRTDALSVMRGSQYLQDGGVTSLRKTLLQNWQQVNEATRDREIV